MEKYFTNRFLSLASCYFFCFSFRRLVGGYQRILLRPIHGIIAGGAECLVLYRAADLAPGAKENNRVQSKHREILRKRVVLLRIASRPGNLQRESVVRHWKGGRGGGWCVCCFGCVL